MTNVRPVPLAALFALVVVLALFPARAQNPVRLCGSDFRRALIHHCGASHWRRELGLKALNWESSSTENSDFDRFPAALKGWKRSSEDSGKSSDPLGHDRNPDRLIFKRNENNIADKCCQRGCTKKDLDTIC
ncbi:hypothetical protein scyTo_0008129 [Scyliorhinus torazame]|uniref:Insulin-like domain-containing protein n=1 Tax=Scyliorhinus torazame TaxID=75743 RepID=A0A401P3Y7_SCYTO|nr:hypothetical protein [Scyliorhinus torazame]